MKVFTAVTLVVFLCCLEVVLSYPRPIARTQERIAGHQGMAGPQEYEAAYISTELCMQLYAVHFPFCFEVYYVQGLFAMLKRMTALEKEYISLGHQAIATTMEPSLSLSMTQKWAQPASLWSSDRVISKTLNLTV